MFVKVIGHNKSDRVFFLGGGHSVISLYLLIDDDDIRQ